MTSSAHLSTWYPSRVRLFGTRQRHAGLAGGQIADPVLVDGPVTRRRQRLKDGFEQTSGDRDWDVSRHVRMAQTDVAPRFGGSIDVAAEQLVPEHGHFSIVRV